MGSRAAASGGKGKAGVKGKAGGRKPKLTSREIDEKYIKQGMELGEYIMGKRDTLPVQRWMRDGRGGVKASSLLGIEAARAANAPMKGFNKGGRGRRSDGPD